MEGCPADDIGFTESGGVLQQQGVDVFIVGVGAAFFDEFGTFAGGGMGELLFELVNKVVVFGFVGEEFVNFRQNFIGAKFLFGAGRNEVSEFVFKFFATIHHVGIPFNEVVVENFFFKITFAVVGGEEFFEFVFFVGFGVEEGVGFEDFEGFFFILFTIELAFTAGGENFVKKVGKGAKDVGFAKVGAGDVDGFFKYFQEVFARGVFFFVAEVGVTIEYFVVDSDGFKVVFNNFPASIFAGILVGEVGF